MTTPAGPAEAPKAPANTAKNVVCICGANEQSLEVAGQTVGAVRQKLAEVLNIPKDAIARVGGDRVKDSQVLREGERLEFIKPSADKG